MRNPGPRLDPKERARLDDEWLDATLAESFPASDPLPLFHGEPDASEPDASEPGLERDE